LSKKKKPLKPLFIHLLILLKVQQPRHAGVAVFFGQILSKKKPVPHLTRAKGSDLAPFKYQVYHSGTS